MSQPAKSLPRTLSSDDIKHDWEAIIEDASGGEDIVVEVNGEAKSVLISFEAYKEYQAIRQRMARSEMLTRLEALQRRQAERNKDLTDEEIDEIAIRTGREINEAVTKEWRATLDSNHP